MKTGIDRLIEEELFELKGQRIGLLVHPASINQKLEYTLTLLHQNKDAKVIRLFGPEHGLWGIAQDMEGVDSQLDHFTRLPIISLYGHDLESLKPKPEDLKDLDVIVCDLQDVGSRYYTFIYSIIFCMEVAAKLNKKVLVLDRPNPINGNDIEGPLLQKGFESFVGAYAGLPARHGMTVGELAHFINEEHNIECDLHVIKMQGWRRDQYFDETKYPWILPSPNMPTIDTAVVYPGMCLLEATNLSEGRGTTRPFEIFGAPYIDPLILAKELNSYNLAGVIFRPLFFKPGFQKWTHQTCGGVQLHVTDRKNFKPYRTGVACLKAVIDLYPNEFEWREKPYEFVSDIPAIDLLTGSSKLRHELEHHQPLLKIFKSWEKDEDEFKEKRQSYLMY